MARGLPAFWGAIFGAPLLTAGVYLYGFAAEYPLVASQPESPPEVGLVVAAFGLFIVGMGAYVHFVAAPEAPQKREGERLIEERKPAQRNALAEAIIAVPILLCGGYLLYFTERPLYQPTLAVAIGLVLFSRGLYRYWQNTLTTYFLTNQRVIEEYRFISLLRNEVPLEKVRGVAENRSVWDSLFGLGNLAVRSGASGGLTVSIEEVYEPAEFAELVRAELTPEQSTDGSPDDEAGADQSTDDATLTDEPADRSRSGRK